MFTFGPVCPPAPFTANDWKPFQFSVLFFLLSERVFSLVLLIFLGCNEKLADVRSGAMFSDQYIDKEDNHKIKDVIFEFLTSTDGGINLNEIDAEDPEISDYTMIPDSSKLADSVRVCLQESDEIPADYTRLFEHRLFSISIQLVPSAIRAYREEHKKYFSSANYSHNLKI
jgi:hypothetical protein